MKKIIFILIAIGLLWNSQISSANAFEIKAKKLISLSIALDESCAEEKLSSNQDDEKENYEWEYLAFNILSKELPILKLPSKANDNFALLNFISPVFTPPPDLS